MCGIFCCVSKHDNNHACFDQHLELLMRNRGPNAQTTLKYANIHLTSSVLWHQGANICRQPLENNELTLLFNGDIFNIHDHESSNTISDTELLFGKLSQNSSSEEALIACFKALEGPYSIILLNKLQQCIYFARDSLGRNSLLLQNTEEHLNLLSVTYMQNSSDTIELPPLGVFKIDLNDLRNCSVYPWQTPDQCWQDQADMLEKSCNLKLSIKSCIQPQWLLKEPSDGEEYTYNFYTLAIKDSQSSSCQQLFDQLMQNHELVKAIDTFARHLENSVQKRVKLTTECCANCLSSRTKCNHSKIAILFSGGIDCSILALLVDKYVPQTDSIDLINVAFQTPNGKNVSWDVPDRISAKNALSDLQKICPQRNWNFIEINVTREELHEQLTKHIKHLICPLNTVLDESIGCAFWFASQNQRGNGASMPESSARVVILGSGADELFAGYVRHKNAFNRCSGSLEDKEKCLGDELEMDWRRIPSRNLARDDRVIADNGKTPRAPFIEENVVKFVRSLRPNQRCCFLYEDGVGDKMFLRLYGNRLGLMSSSFLKKRAIQFGSKIANKKQNAKDRSEFLTNVC